MTRRSRRISNRSGSSPTPPCNELSRRCVAARSNARGRGSFCLLAGEADHIWPVRTYCEVVDISVAIYRLFQPIAGLIRFQRARASSDIPILREGKNVGRLGARSLRWVCFAICSNRRTRKRNTRPSRRPGIFVLILKASRLFVGLRGHAQIRTQLLPSFGELFLELVGILQRRRYDDIIALLPIRRRRHRM